MLNGTRFAIHSLSFLNHFFLIICIRQLDNNRYAVYCEQADDIASYIYIYEDSTGKKEHVTDLIKQHIIFQCSLSNDNIFPCGHVLAKQLIRLEEKRFNL